ncbi:MAG: hypothetical protein K1X86_12565 [Ignavibacteria bacterium]|nr:hypothetical protein [Ignavibacteria bacterium]
MKQFINGYYSPRVEVETSPGIFKTYNFSFKYQALKEYYHKKSVYFNLPDGRKKKKTRFIEYRWVLSFEQAIWLNDTLMIKEIENADTTGLKIYLTPHRDIPSRRFRVILEDEEQVIDRWPASIDNFGIPNRGLKMTFLSADKITSLDWIDPNLEIGIMAEEFGEYLP